MPRRDSPAAAALNIASIKVDIVRALPERQDIVTLSLSPGATVRDALAAYRGRTDTPPAAGGLEPESGVARYGKPVRPEDALADGDRLEILRPLTVDPKEARRRRAEVQATRKKRAAAPRQRPVTSRRTT